MLQWNVGQRDINAHEICLTVSSDSITDFGERFKNKLRGLRCWQN